MGEIWKASYCFPFGLYNSYVLLIRRRPFGGVPRFRGVPTWCHVGSDFNLIRSEINLMTFCYWWILASTSHCCERETSHITLSKQSNDLPFLLTSWQKCLNIDLSIYSDYYTMTTTTAAAPTPALATTAPTTTRTIITTAAPLQLLPPNLRSQIWNQQFSITNSTPKGKNHPFRGATTSRYWPQTARATSSTASPSQSQSSAEAVTFTSGLWVIDQWVCVKEATTTFCGL